MFEKRVTTKSRQNIIRTITKVCLNTEMRLVKIFLFLFLFLYIFRYPTSATTNHKLENTGCEVSRIVEYILCNQKSSDSIHAVFNTNAKNQTMCTKNRVTHNNMICIY